MVPFAIGSETAGSITYPASRCGVTALRPTFGAVGRTGVMSISESLVLFFVLVAVFLWAVAVVEGLCLLSRGSGGNEDNQWVLIYLAG